MSNVHSDSLSNSQSSVNNLTIIDEFRVGLARAHAPAHVDPCVQRKVLQRVEQRFHGGTVPYAGVVRLQGLYECTGLTKSRAVW